MSDATGSAFRERMVAAVRYFAVAADDNAARRELAALLAFGSGAVAMFDAVLTELSADGSISRASLTSLRAFAIHVQRSTGRHAVNPAWLDLPPDDGATDETVLRGNEDDPPASPADREAPPVPDPANGVAPAGEAAHDDELPKGTLCANRYIVEYPIAVGGMSTVYRAIDDRNGQVVALKVLRRPLTDDPDMVATFEREADNAWMLRDPGFVRVLAQGWIDRQPFLALEYLEGESLGTAMKGRFATGGSWPAVQRILTRIGASIAHAHAHGLVHADLKPGNIFLLRNDAPRVLDLGAAQVVHGDARLDLERDRDPGGGALTPAYASPEMLLGASAEPRDDIFSLAVIGYELYAGRHPFDRYTADRARHLDIRPPRPPRLPRHAWRTLRRGLALRRDRRPSTMAAFVTGLRTPFPTATVATATLLLALVLGYGAWSHYRPDAVRGHPETGRQAMALATDLVGLRPLPPRPADSLALAHRIAETTGWRMPLDSLISGLVARMDPATLETATFRNLQRAVDALVTLRLVRPADDRVAAATLAVTHALAAGLSELVLRSDLLPVEGIAARLELMNEVDPDSIRVVAPHLTDLLNDRRRRLPTVSDRAEFDRRAERLVQWFPIIPPPVSGPY